MRNKRREDVDDSTSSSGGVTTKPIDVDVIKAIAVSSIEYSHRSSVSDISWTATEVNYNGEIQKGNTNNNATATNTTISSSSVGTLTEGDNSKEGGKSLLSSNNNTIYSQLVSVGLDGALMFWDLRYKKDIKSLDHVWRPTFRVPLLSMDGTFDYGITKVALDSAASLCINSSNNGNTHIINHHERISQPTSRLWCATEEGDVIQADWLADKENTNNHTNTDTKGGSNSRVDLVSGVHYGPVADIIRSPIFPDILLSVGAWSCNVWTDQCSTPLVSSSIGLIHMTCGTWSPTRPGVFFIGRGDGLVEIWDMLDRTHQASQIQSISSAPISAINVQTYYAKGQPSHQFIAIGDDEGTVHVLEIPRTLFRPGKNEKVFIRALLDREIKRVAYVNERKAFKQQQKQEGSNFKEETTQATEKEETNGSSTMDGDALEKAYHELETSTLELLHGAA